MVLNLGVEEEEKQLLKKEALQAYSFLTFMLILALVLYLIFKFSILQIFLIYLGLYILMFVLKFLSGLLSNIKEGWF